MEKQAAVKLIRETFESSFEKERFVFLAKNLFNHLEEAHFIYRGNTIPDAFDPYIKTLERVGKYADPGGHKIDVLIAHLKKETSLERARPMQRNFIAWYLDGSRGGIHKDAAVVAFVSPEREDWRFSIVKMEYSLAKAESGKIKAQKELTPARRLSFLVGKNENSHTAQKQLLSLLENDEYNPHLSDFEEAFNIEKVTKEFFQKYRELFIRAKESLDDIVEKDRVVAKDFANKNVHTVNFSKKLLGQIVFLYFLQKKGWFGVKRGKDWGDGSKHFLRELFKKEHGGYKNFFNDILEPLFYEALRLERPADYYSRFECRIPFLNGGLFDPINDYNWQDTDILLPNGLFSNDEKTKEGDTGTGILDVFDRYNFTVKEDEPLEKEVAIDPEMLGKVFENLLEVKDRKSKGTYYTPREIVHYMCQESLINYLRTELNPSEPPQEEDEKEVTQEKLFGKPEPKQMKLLAGKQKKNQAVSREDIETLIKYGETAVEHDSRVINEGRETETYSFKLPESIRSNAQIVDDKLSAIRVCDPAIGSGAFLVGMMNEIVRARNALSSYLSFRVGAGSEPAPTEQRKPLGGSRTAPTIYEYKRHAIQNCLYGVDIDAGSTEIAKLRLWLSLVVDEEDIKQIKPLPNLDYKIVCGNSLLGVEQDLTNVHLFDQLEKLKPLHFNETSAGKKQKYKEQIDALFKELTHNETKFDFEIYFSEVFHEKKGFDVVIANPPYVFGGNKGISEQEKKLFKSIYFSGTQKINLFAIFLEKGTKILRKKGFLTYILPNTLLRVTSYKNIREYLTKKTKILEIVDLDVGIFEDVTASTITISVENTEPEFSNPVLIKRGIGCEKFNILKQKDFDNKGYIFNIFSKRENRGIIEKLKTDSLLLGVLAKNIRFGVVITKNLDKVVADIRKNTDWKPFLEGNEIGAYYIKHLGRFLHYKKKLLHRSRTPDIFETEKILIQRITGGSRPIKAAYDTAGFYNKESIINLILLSGKEDDYKYLLSLLNSSLINWFYSNKFTNESKLTVNLSKEYLSEIPIKKIHINEQQILIALVDCILAITKDDDYLTNTAKQAKVREYEREIDELVYKLYDLTPEEIKIVEGQG